MRRPCLRFKSKSQRSKLKINQNLNKYFLEIWKFYFHKMQRDLILKPSLSLPCCPNVRVLMMLRYDKIIKTKVSLFCRDFYNGIRYFISLIEKKSYTI